MQEEQQGYKVLVEQAAHEVHKGAFDRALCYLNKAIRVFSILHSFLNILKFYV